MKIIFLALSLFSFAMAQTSTNGTTLSRGFDKKRSYEPLAIILPQSEAWTNSVVYNSDNNWRHSVYSGDQGQIVLMTISPSTNPGNDVPNEVHDFDQYIFVQSGDAMVSIDRTPHQKVSQGGWILIPAYMEHHIKNGNATQPLKLLNIYTKWDTQEPNAAFKTLREEEAS